MYKMWKVADTSIWELYDMQQNPGWDNVPGISGMRKNRRRRVVHDFLSDKPGDTWRGDDLSETLGQFTSTLPVGAAAYFPGRALMRRIPKLGLKGNKSGLIVSALAMIASHLGGKRLAASSFDRTMQDQYNAVNRHNRRGLNWWFPGYAKYQRDMTNRYVESIKNKDPRELIERRQALIPIQPKKKRKKKKR